MSYEAAIGRRLALVLWAKDGGGTDDVAVFCGELQRSADSFFLVRGESAPPFEIREEWLSRIMPVADELKEILMNSEFQLSLTVGDVREGDVDLQETGLKWPAK